jgi:acetyltransferase-like isoleucine patch superfamily enzyme
MPESTSSHLDLQNNKRSSGQKYRDFTVGGKSFLFLLKYELITSLFGNFPGALGFFLRRIFYSRLIKSAGKGIIWGRGITLRHPHKIEIGDGAAVNDFAVLDAYGDNTSRIKIGRRSLISRNTIISSKGGSIEIGERTNIGTVCIIFSRDCHVAVGNDVLMSAYCYLMGGGDHSMERTDIPIANQGAECRGIDIGDGVWFGAGVKVKDGSKIGRDSVIGTNSFVNSNIPSFSIAAGTPAKVMKKRESLKNKP